eukprot:CAMPEP_0198226176 /NCGR_PEP_ID=MMETSP1445-20131203/104212_1 /TAXON_ID=36898 /ORGANISM="Pyramimonas sp., Strain CCMP2087" /LENGTH=42 /DNA_ID= /DNA_START= /DNA_END= /DNA_ORIENTATION=
MRTLLQEVEVAVGGRQPVRDGPLGRGLEHHCSHAGPVVGLHL